MVAQVEHAPGVDAALGDLGQGEHGQEHSSPSRRRRRNGCRSSTGAARRRGSAGASAVPGSVTRAQTPTPSATTAIPGQTQRQETPAWMTQRGDGRAGQRAGVEQGVQAHQRLGAAHQPVRGLGVHGRVDGAAGDLHQDEHHAEGPRVVGQRQHAEEDRPGEQRDPQQPARPDPVAEVRHDRAGRARHGDGHGQQHAELRVVEREGVLDVEQHHGPAAPEEAEGGEGRHHRPGPGEQAAAPRWWAGSRSGRARRRPPWRGRWPGRRRPG